MRLKSLITAGIALITVVAIAGPASAHGHVGGPYGDGDDGLSEQDEDFINGCVGGVVGDGAARGSLAALGKQAAAKSNPVTAVVACGVGGLWSVNTNRPYDSDRPDYERCEVNNHIDC